MKLRAVKEFTIDRERWFVGMPGGTSGELRIAKGDEDYSPCDYGRQCCLGFYLNACGVPQKQLVGQALPNDLAILRTIAPEGMRWLFAKDGSDNYSASVVKLVSTNDRGRIKAKDREARIKEGFAKQGVTVRFVGSYGKRAVVE
jgi:hypothetical protein